MIQDYKGNYQPKSVWGGSKVGVGGFARCGGLIANIYRRIWKPFMIPFDMHALSWWSNTSSFLLWLSSQVLNSQYFCPWDFSCLLGFLGSVWKYVGMIVFNQWLGWHSYCPWNSERTACAGAGSRAGKAPSLLLLMHVTNHFLSHSSTNKGLSSKLKKKKSCTHPFLKKELDHICTYNI